jgi:hypothetical protein
MLAWPVGITGQQLRDVVGTVLAVRDSSAIEGVHVQVVSLGLSALTDTRGVFRLRGVPRARLAVTLTRIGVTSDSVWLEPAQDTLVVFLRPAAVELAPVTTEARPVARERFEQIVQPSVVSIDRETITRIPGLAEADVVRAVQLLPGTIATNDYTVGFNVRGGEPDQNLIQLDGITIFNPSHLGGLFSTFDADAVEDVEFATGAFPAEYGGRLSSVMDVAVRPGRSDRLGLRGNVSLISSKALLEGPVPGTGASVLLAARRTYADALIGALSSETMPYYFADALAKVSWPFQSGGGVSATGYWGRDVVNWPWIEEEPGREGIDLVANWGNRLLGLRLAKPLGATELTVDAGVTEFSAAFGLEPGIFAADNNVRMLTSRVVWALSPGSEHDVRMGGGIEDYRMTYDVSSESFSASYFEAVYAPRIWSAFVDDQWQAFPWLMLRPGIRMEAVQGPDVVNWAPRIGFKSFLSTDFALTGSVGRYHQAIHSLRDQNVSWNILDFWIGADTILPVAKSDHLVLGFETWLTPAISLSVEGYWKSFDNIIDANLEEDTRIQGDETIPVAGDAWGADVLLMKHSGNITGWIAYGLSKATRWTAEQEYAAVHDRRHTLNLVLQAPGPLGSDASVRLGYGSPLPYTPFIGEWRHRFYQATEHEFDDFQQEPIASSVLNSARYPYYSRVDVSFKWEVEKWGGVLMPYVQFVNLMNKKNVFFYTFDYGTTPPTRSALSQLPLLPTFGLEFQF